MKWPNHLFLETMELAPSAEWTVECPGWCFVCMREGQAYWLAGHSAMELNSGEVLALSPLREGFLRASQLGPISLAHFRFSPEMLSGLLTPADKDSFEALAAQPQNGVRFFPARAPGARLFARAQRRSVQGNALLHRAELLRLVGILFADVLARPVPAATVVLSARQKLKLLVNQMPEAEFLKMTPRGMAAHCGNSVTHFNRSFRKLFGRSLARKQELIRLQKARQALLETACALESLAIESGYRNAQEFSAAFKKQFGLSPRQWRQPSPFTKARARAGVP